MKSFLRILKYITQYRNYAILNVVFNLFAIAFSVVSLAMLIPFLNLLFGNEKYISQKPVFQLSSDFVIDYFNYFMGLMIQRYEKIGALAVICVIIIIVFFLKNLFRYLALLVLSVVRNGVIRDIRYDLYNKILHLPISFFTEKRKGDIITRTTSDVQEIEVSIMSMLEVAFKEPVTIIGYLGFMLFMSPQLTLFVLILLPLTGLIIGRIGKTLKRESAKGQNKLGFIISIIEESISGLRIIKAFNAEKTQSNKFRKENNALFSIMTKMLRRRDISSPLSEFLGITTVVIVLWFGGKLVLQEGFDLSPATFITFIVIFSQIIPPAKAFSTAFYNIQKGLASVERIESILDTDIKIKEKANPVSIKGFQHSIEFKNISFSYEENLVLKAIDLKIKKGMSIALVGPSGAGKSTMADLIPRFYDPNKGKILIDGIDIKDYKLYDLRNLMGIVTQESILFNDTVFNNIAYGIENATEEQVVEAAKIANAHRFIIKMENRYDTFIGDSGSKLSGGERQRLSIARAVLKNPPILILDEATSSLDTASEKLVQDALLKLMQNRTSIVIAHRLSTIQHADEIIVLDQGAIIEHGKHKSLLAKKGMYMHLVELQAF